ncbi:hypothetical protein KP77_09070 [Jeotgalibacillus alimentarius]|uniref:DUF4177 domain-containing protein n=1 Tax=Jeotgalibacillus alimentarius TaxID=135826 RepID=A0A0C2RMB2_9BACL|nr:DUF4177 domain-containing protein [Jeotgalibacillus alimentarius]KIL51395.1 hypothetical protein KP77_09070 [Jeotgalibacillus alimentarius]
MKKFEYRIEYIEIRSNDKDEIERRLLDMLNQIGSEGWELSGINGPMLYFKREVIN